MTIADDSWREALFDDLLRSIRLRSSVYFRPEFRAPWGFSVAGKGTAFHIVARGKCWLEVKGVAKPVPLSTGDFVVMPRGDPHVIRNEPATRSVNIFDLAKICTPDKNKKGVFCAGGEGPVTKLVCGRMQFETGATDPLLAILPPLIHVKGTRGGTASWLRLTVKHVLAELDSGRAGTEAVVTRLADILFIQAVRAYLEENVHTAESGWLAAVRDPQIGRALALLHSHPQEPWTVASLAKRAALSRSAFAAKFTQLVGEPPRRYLTRLRLNAATIHLGSSDEKLSVIAASAGYESVAAFTKAFKRHLGVTPGAYRRARSRGGSV